MFDIGFQELLVIVVVAVLVIGPKDMPLAMRTAGRWIGKVRKVSSHFRTGIDAMVREAELEDMEKKWKAQNDAIMKQSATSNSADNAAPLMTGPPVASPADTAPDAGDGSTLPQKNDANAESKAASNKAGISMPPKSGE